MDQFKTLFRDKLGPNWTLAFTVGLTLCFFLPILFSRRVISPTKTLFSSFPWSVVYPDRVETVYRHFGDVVDYYFPAIIFLLHWVRQGILPLWNPTVTGGQPFFFAISFFLYPINFIYLFMPLELAFTWHAMVRLTVASIFTFLLARELGLMKIPSILAALTFAFNGFHMVWLGWPHASESILLPVMLWLTHRSLTRGQTRYFIALILTTGILLAGGFLPIAGYILYATVGYALAVLWKSYQSDVISRRILVNRMASLGLAIGAGLFLSAVHLLPFMENLVQSGYGAERANDSVLYRNFHLPWWQLILYLIPGYYGGIDTPYWGSVNLIETLGYVGVLPLLFAIVSLVRLRFGSMRSAGYLYCLSLTILSLSVVYGLKPLSLPVTLLPGFQLAINTRLLSVAAFGLAMLAAYGLEFLQQLKTHHKQPGPLFYIISLSFLLVGLVITIESLWILSPDSPSSFNQDIYGVFGQPSSVKLTIYKALREGSLSLLQSALMSGFQLLTGVVIIIIYFRTNLSPKIVQLLILALVVVDLFGFAYWYLPIRRSAPAYPETPSLKIAQAQSSPARFLSIAGRVLPGNTASVYQFQNAAGHSFSHPARYTKYLSELDQNVWNRREHGTHLFIGQHITDLDSRLIDLLNIRYILEAPIPEEKIKLRAVASQPESPVHVGEIYGTIQQGQTFLATADNLLQIDLLLATYARTNHQDVIFHLKTDPAASEDLVRITIPADQIADNQWFSFSFDPIPDSEGHKFYFLLESPTSQSGDAITIWSTENNAYLDGQRYVNGVPVEGDLTFRALAQADLPAKFDIHPASDMLIFENRTVLPRAYAVPNSIVVTDEKQILRLLQSPTFDPYQEVILEEDSGAEIARGSFSFDPSHVEIKLYEPNRVVLESNLPESGWVILTDLNYPGWIAEVDGQRVKLHQANYLFRAVSAPAGQHTITFRFQPGSITYGLMISLITLLGILLIIAQRWWIPLFFSRKDLKGKV
jgi:hypothetical protein